MEFIYFHGSQCCSSCLPIQNKTKIQNGRWKKVSFWFQTISAMSQLTVPLLERPLRWQGSSVLIASYKFEVEMNPNFYAILSLSMCMVQIPYRFPGPLLYQNLKRAQTFSPVSLSHRIFFTAQTMMPTGILLLFVVL